MEGLIEERTGRLFVAYWIINEVGEVKEEVMA